MNIRSRSGFFFMNFQIKLRLFSRNIFGALMALAFIYSVPARSQELVVQISGNFAILNVASNTLRDAVILFQGGSGNVGIDQYGATRLQNPWIISTRRRYVQSGISSLLVDQGTNPIEAIKFMKSRRFQRVYLVGESRGCLRAMAGLSGDISGIILVSCMMDQVQSVFRSPEHIPKKTLVIHHRQDRCFGTLPHKFEEFLRWAGPRVEAHWMTGGADDGGHPCRSQTFHGMKGNEGKVVSRIIQFVKR